MQKLARRFEEALVYAAQKHAEQLRKGTDIPYLAHLLGVTALVLEDGGSEEEAIAALLHDAVEDQGGQETHEEIRRMFGEEIARIVDGCTDADTTPKPAWRQRKERYVKHISDAPPGVLRVSLADKLYNARAILRDLHKHGDAVWDRFNGGKEGTLWYYRALVNAFRERCSGWMVEELERVVSELERLVSNEK